MQDEIIKDILLNELSNLIVSKFKIKTRCKLCCGVKIQLYQSSR